ncbi:MAG: prepilin-type N-terminal cleavage/methylation domain-containing protein [Tepidisphaeraceae bacterium]|jgi:prepilin-type N-terminal cleavage/methylation domain-containing protein/prepilin-type processing-associated H-X9-DG protein
MSYEKRGGGFTLIEVLVVSGIIAVLLGILLPAAERVRHQGYIDKCASNLRQIGMGISMYCNENRGNYPRTLYVAGAPLTQGTGFTAADPFQAGGVSANDLTAAPYLLLRAEHLPTDVFMCPYNDGTSYAVDPADPAKHSNFTDWTKNLAYSFADPYPSTAVADAGYRLTSHMRGDFPVAADLNPGVTPYANVTVAMPGASDRVNEQANSRNHEQDGQNVLYADGHVSFEHTCLCGIGQDNIYTNQANQFDNVSPVSPTDSILLPHGQ